MFSKSNNVIFLVAILLIISSLFLINTCNNSSSKIPANFQSNTQDDLLEIKYLAFDSLLKKYTSDNNLTILFDSIDQKTIFYKISNWKKGNFDDFTCKNAFLYKNYANNDTFEIHTTHPELDIPDTVNLSIKVYSKNNEPCCKIPADIVFSICKNSIK